MDSIASGQPAHLDDSGTTLQLIADSIKGNVHELNSFTGSTEEEFLRLGSDLFQFQQRAENIGSTATEVVNLVAGEEIADGISTLSGVVDRMNFFLESALGENRQSTSALARLLDILDGLDGPLEGFRKINKMLRMLGISTRIESTRLLNGGEGFENLASDVQQLYLQINEKASSVNDLKKNLNMLIMQTIDRILKIENELQTKVGKSLEQASTSLAVLTDSNLNCREFAASIAAASADVYQNICEVVMSMQFHDITRQQLEHAAEALGEMRRMMHDKLDSCPGVSDLQDVAANMMAVAELQVAQISHASDELTGAVDNIIRNLEGISSMEASIAKEAREMSGAADGAGSSFFKEMEINLNSVATALQRSIEENRHLVQALEGVDKTIEEISSFVNDIRTIGEEIELIAINSQIKAARTGADGASLGIVAEAIQRLSLEARSQTGEISRILEGINKGSDDLCNGVNTESAHLEEEVSEITICIRDLLRMLNEVNNRFVVLLDGIEREVENLNRDVLRETAGITVNERAKAVLGEVMENLSGSIVMMRPLIGSAAATVRLTGLSGRYTMHSERKIHERLTASGKGEAAAVDKIPIPQVAVPEDLGANVELF